VPNKPMPECVFLLDRQIGRHSGRPPLPATVEDEFASLSVLPEYFPPEYFPHSRVNPL
jgi:hypothetical protein